ncbi:hypothetical protein C5E10_12995 [Pseudoclavibacter sp. RFBG4]|uniref:cyclophilin-like fold protein n=1 Tax=Pseudoclavibacter sp. RFBG4 TaxID=2080575 RepID=UPI000CE7B6F9|nr:cyclophilin-like fold protein [Pseudoclavibacter sp. RFBG4]PPG28795.1 hypothetical protein C5E10_12995 [Pseudoclavibacter sp. RFBG4]
MSTIAIVCAGKTRAAAASLLAAGLLLAGCTGVDAPGESASEAASHGTGATSSTPPSAASATEGEDLMPTTTNITISMGDVTVRGVLNESATSADLLTQLPLELSFEDFGGQEKIATLPRALSLEGMPSGSAAEAGTIGYYAPNEGLVLYYDSVGHFPGIIPIGTFEDVAAVRAAVPATGTVSAE